VPSDLSTPIEYVKGVGPQRAALLKKELSIHSLGDLLNHFPFRYIDRSSFVNISDASDNAAAVQIKGTMGAFSEVGHGSSKRLIAPLFDKTGSLELVWFKGQKWIKSSLKEGKSYIVFGKVARYGAKLSIAHPEMELVDENALPKGLQAVYSSTEKLINTGLSSRGIEKLIAGALPGIVGWIEETLPDYLIEKHRLISREEAIINIHQPRSEAWANAALYRLKFEELFLLQLYLLQRKLAFTQKTVGHRFSLVGDHFNDFFKNYLPFELTGAQKKVIKEIRYDLGAGYHMNRLVQGDVGSGKTMVALLVSLLALDNGFQACLMAPTEILAKQHMASFQNYLKDLPVKVALLTGSTKKKDRKLIFEELQSGEISILIGTHALIEPDVKFKNLGLAVIDEQHRFGVEQRAKMWRKNSPPPHILVMTATPIPRTLAMTLYGDLDISVINELPPGRKDVKTLHRFDKHRLEIFGFIEKQIAEGRQVYVVYPLIEESETLDYKDLMDGYESITRRFPIPDYQVSILHGQMKAEAKEFEMSRFKKGETQILVATTVIEVGVDVPNASVMVIESAERFGLSQLHQLRGRVGRGAEQSYCILVSSFKLSADAKTRLQAMTESNDGFALSEIDLKLRGPGDMMGTRQSGLIEFKIADLVKDQSILIQARKLASKIIGEDPDLVDDRNSRLKKALILLKAQSKDWSNIS
jgi:ATP-dependent DNA helicase RecG